MQVTSNLNCFISFGINQLIKERGLTWITSVFCVFQFLFLSIVRHQQHTVIHNGPPAVYAFVPLG